CHEELKKNSTDPPPCSLASQLWIGCIPWQLQVLTFPEQLLITLLYPHVYVFKLFPKWHGGVLNTSTCQCAITYSLDMAGIAAMVEGKLMPHPPVILASLISMTFIGMGDLPKNWIHSMFWVQQHVVFEALHWLKEHNVKHYGDIEINAPWIESLPEDDIPEEIMSII
ncbi:hypothetical protein F5J12DRAFT_713196, partial [Pisolithus orientalis]|uniref:uncharacterized protein n=1 Tax=Pisolithus orientalis TaxID=936130 RepID=UPI002225737E